MAKIDVKGRSVTIISGGVDDYISLTDIACPCLGPTFSNGRAGSHIPCR